MNEHVSGETMLPAKTPLRTGAAVAPIVPRTYEEAWRIATHYVKTGMAPRDMKTPERVMISLMAGMEIGLPPIAALNNIAIINNRPRIWGAAVPALAINTGQLVAWDEAVEGEGEAMVARCLIARRVGPDLVIRKETTFSVADARQAGLWDERPTVDRWLTNYDTGKKEKKTVPNDSPWYRYRKRMMTMRARQAFTDLFSDIFCGLGIAEAYVSPDTDADMRDVTPPSPERIHNPLGSDDPDPIDPDAIVPPKELDPVLPGDRMTEEELLAGLQPLMPPEPREEVVPPAIRPNETNHTPDARPPGATGAGPATLTNPANEITDPSPEELAQHRQPPEKPQDAPPVSAAPKEPPTPRRAQAKPADAAQPHPDKVTFKDPMRYGGQEYIAHLGQWLELVTPDLGEAYIRERFKSQKEMSIRNNLGTKLTVEQRNTCGAMCKTRCEQLGAKP